MNGDDMGDLLQTFGLGVALVFFLSFIFNQLNW